MGTSLEDLSKQIGEVNDAVGAGFGEMGTRLIALEKKTAAFQEFQKATELRLQNGNGKFEGIRGELNGDSDSSGIKPRLAVVETKLNLVARLLYLALGGIGAQLAEWVARQLG